MAAAVPKLACADAGPIGSRRVRVETIVIRMGLGTEGNRVDGFVGAGAPTAAMGEKFTRRGTTV